MLSPNCRFLSVTALLAACSVLLLTQPATAQSTLEGFETNQAAWLVRADASGSGAVSQTTALTASGAASTRLTIASSGSRAAIRTDFSDPAISHTRAERPGTYRW